MEKLQHRNDANLPPLPDKLVRGAPGSVISPIVVQPIEILAPKPNIQEKIISPIIEKIRVEQGLSPKFNAQDAVNSTALEKAINEWKMSQGS